MGNEIMHTFCPVTPSFVSDTKCVRCQSKTSCESWYFIYLKDISSFLTNSIKISTIRKNIKTIRDKEISRRIKINNRILIYYENELRFISKDDLKSIWYWRGQVVYSKWIEFINAFIKGMRKNLLLFNMYTELLCSETYASAETLEI